MKIVSMCRLCGQELQDRLVNTLFNHLACEHPDEFHKILDSIDDNFYFLDENGAWIE